MTKAETKAYARQNIIIDLERSGLKVEAFVNRYNTGMLPRQKFINNLSAGTLYRWIREYRLGGVGALVPRYAPVKGPGARTLTEQDKAFIQAYYLDENRPSLAFALRNIKEYEGREINYDTARRYINGLPRAVLIKKRYGGKAYNDLAAPFINRNYESIEVMQIISADHHILDLLCRHPFKGTPFRPWLTMITDYRSRKPLGWCLDITPNRHTILRALETCVTTYGVPDEIHIDNGKDFKSKLFNGEKVKIKNTDPFESDQALELEGIFGRMGVKVHFATPYRGQAKPVERFFRFVAETFSKEFPSYVGSNTADRPTDTALYYGRINGQEKRGDLFELQEVSALMDLWIKKYSATHKHTGDGMYGRPPDQVFTEESTGAKPVMPLEWRSLVFCEQHKRKVTRTGLEVAGKKYYSEDVIKYIGEDVIVRVPFFEKGKVIVFSLDGRQLFTAWEGYLDDTGDARDNNKLRNSINKKQRQMLEEYMAEPVKRKRLTDKLPEALAAGSESISINNYKPSRPKKQEGISEFFKGV